MFETRSDRSLRNRPTIGKKAPKSQQSDKMVYQTPTPPEKEIEKSSNEEE